MYRTDHAHQWQRTEYAPMSSAYARTLWDDGAILMTGETRPAPFGHTKDGDLIDVRRSGFAVDINTDALPLDVLAERLQPGSVVQTMVPGRCFGASCRQGRAQCTEGCAEQAARNEAARVAGARMAGAGLFDTSEPLPLRALSPMQNAADLAGSVIGWAIVAALTVGVWALVLL